MSSSDSPPPAKRARMSPVNDVLAFADKLAICHQFDLHRAQLKAPPKGAYGNDISTDAIYDEYMKFMTLKAVCHDLRATLLSPAEAVDLMWHTHILDTVAYASFCSKLGRAVGVEGPFFIHHRPEGASETSSRAARRHATAIAYVSRFSVPMPLPPLGFGLAGAAGMAIEGDPGSPSPVHITSSMGAVDGDATRAPSTDTVPRDMVDGTVRSPSGTAPQDTGGEMGPSGEESSQRRIQIDVRDSNGNVISFRAKLRTEWGMVFAAFYRKTGLPRDRLRFLKSGRQLKRMDLVMDTIEEGDPPDRIDVDSLVSQVGC
eukprot:TRINITY_DN3537_c0_g1_i1.p1 TRINITY_DN3537_c0_g1~~TRINITY_DN3537_c0_g1_i1.p1  ORF type:complete len:316 (-),score=27.55 TRINITY_DN3537_c0_g1_i1:811-1758(-)